MKITCPSCTAEYNVPDTLAAGRVVRCAKCGVEWTPVPEPVAEAAAIPAPVPDEPVAVVPQPPPPDPADRLAPPTAAPARPRRGPSALLLAWVGSGLLIVALLAAAVVFREPIMRGWPPSQRVYGALHLRAAPSSDIHGDVVK